MPSEAAPVLTLRDRIDIHLEPIRRVEGSVQVKGRLVQRGTGEGATYMSLRLTMDERWVTLLTDGNGYFSQRFSATEGRHLLSVDVDESDYFDAAHFEMADFDIAKRPLALELDLPNELADTASELTASIASLSEGAPISLELNIFLGTSGETLQKITSIRTDHRGPANFEIPMEQLGGPGRKRMELRFAGDESLDAATVSAQFQISSSSNLSLRINGSAYDYGDLVPVSGRLEDGRGEPIANAIIVLEVQSQRVASTKTDERGDYRIKIDSEELGSGPAIPMQTIYRPSESWKAAAHSTPVSISISERKPIPMSLALAAFVVTGLGLLSFVAMRARPWERWRKSAVSEEGNDDDDEDLPEVPPATGLAAGRPKLSNSFRKPHYRDFAGTVLNTITKRPVDMARLEVSGPSSQILETDATGTFCTEDLNEGQHPVRISADGYVSEEFVVTTPHRGEFHNSTVALLPVREKIFTLYKDALRPRIPDPKLWGIWTPRQILDHVRTSRPSEPLSALTDFVEESFFSQRRPHEDVLPAARALVRAFTEDTPTGRPRA